LGLGLTHLGLGLSVGMATVLLLLVACTSAVAFPVYFSANGSVLVDTAFNSSLHLSAGSGTIVARSLFSADGGIGLNGTRLDEAYLEGVSGALNTLTEAVAEQAEQAAAQAAAMSNVTDTLAAVLGGLSALQAGFSSLAARMDAVEANTGLLDSLVVSPPPPPPSPNPPPMPPPSPLTWQLIFSHRIQTLPPLASEFFADTASALSSSGDVTSSPHMFSLLGALSGMSGPFHFKIVYPLMASPNYNEWTQTSNPLTSTSALGVTPIYTSYNNTDGACTWGGGLRLTSHTDGSPVPTFLNAATEVGTLITPGGCWWFSIGDHYPEWQPTGFPGPVWGPGQIGTGQTWVQLWMYMTAN